MIPKRVSLAIVAVLFSSASLGAGEIRLQDGVIEAIGVGKGETAMMVHVAGAGDLPALAGRTESRDGVLRFIPAFPLSPGMSYRVVLEDSGSDSVSATVTVPPLKRKRVTVVTHVYPKVDVLPENLLKFYIHFSEPMRAGGNYRHIRLLDSEENEVDLPFLELDEELWDPDHRRLTVFLDPARIKRGLVPHEEHGRAIRAGQAYTLVVGRGFEDTGRGRLLREHRKAFKVSKADYDQPLLKDWRITAPAAGTREPLVIDLGEPLDHGLLARVVRVENTPGEARVSAKGRRWEFLPDRPWKPGAHRVLVGTILEDLAGNSLQRPFEVLPGLPFIENLKETESLDFEVRERGDGGDGTT